MKTLLRALAVSGLCAAGLTAAPALAQTPVFEFRVERASLTTEQDVRAAYARLESEASRYCRALDLASADETARCRIEMVAHVVEAAGHEALARRHDALTEARTVADAG